MQTWLDVSRPCRLDLICLYHVVLSLQSLPKPCFASWIIWSYPLLCCCQASGVTVKDECVSVWEEIKIGHKYSYIIYKISKDLKQIEVDCVGKLGKASIININCQIFFTKSLKPIALQLWKLLTSKPLELCMQTFK